MTNMSKKIKPKINSYLGSPIVTLEKKQVREKSKQKEVIL